MSAMSNQLEQVFAEKEHLAEEIIFNKQLVVDYDRKRNSNREALTQIKKKVGDEKKLWTFFGDMFIKLPTEKTKELIEKDQASLNENIDIARTAMKSSAQKLEVLEGRNNMKGFNLASLNGQ
ncbi:hypothetical protein K501DRAFT_330624 [Backusella circina FSU 941]|nr:hypothetical protein K501DRAFT_330624 [Backusella circina FSU 941]